MALGLAASSWASGVVRKVRLKRAGVAAPGNATAREKKRVRPRIGLKSESIMLGAYW